MKKILIGVLLEKILKENTQELVVEVIEVTVMIQQWMLLYLQSRV